MSLEQEYDSEIAAVPAIPSKKKFRRLTAERLDGGNVAVHLESVLTPNSGAASAEVRKTFTLTQFTNALNAKLAGAYNALEATILENM